MQYDRSSALSAVQLSDITDWGGGGDVARLLLPAGVRVQSFSSTQIARPPRDTRTVKGVVELPPLTVYKCALASFC